MSQAPPSHTVSLSCETNRAGPRNDRNQGRYEPLRYVRRVFLSLDATTWAALAAVGAFVAALASAVTAVVTHWSTGARPRVVVELAALDEYSVRRRRLRPWPMRSTLPPRWSAGRLEGAVVRVENKGRTALTATTPQFEVLDQWRRPRRWLRALPWRRHSIGTKLLPFRDMTTADRVRIEPHDYAEFLAELSPLFGDPSSAKHPWRVPRDWHHVRVRVPIAGRRDAVVRRPIMASPRRPQLSGATVTLEQFLTRHYLAGLY